MASMIGFRLPRGDVWDRAAMTGAVKEMGWPLRNLSSMATITEDGMKRDVQGNHAGGPLRPWANRLSDYVAVQAGSLPKIILAVFVWMYTVDMHAAAEGWAVSWVAKVVTRDIVLMLLCAWGWDYMLYFSPLKARLASFKLNQQYPSWEQIKRDAFWTTSATVLASAQEVLLMRWWASGRFTRALFGSAPADELFIPATAPFFGTADTAVFSTPALPLVGQMHFHTLTLGFMLWTMTMLYWRIVHFHFIHRVMHPWWHRKNGLQNGDVGAFLYRWVHAHHHKSYNPTALSGISMTPVESVSYLSAALIPLLFRSGAHPWIHLYTKLDLIIGAQIGHDGFDFPGGGSYFHQIHHAHFECNYGDSAVPLDWLFGTFEDGSRWNSTAPAKKKM